MTLQELRNLICHALCGVLRRAWRLAGSAAGTATMSTCQLLGLPRLQRASLRSSSWETDWGMLNGHYGSGALCPLCLKFLHGARKGRVGVFQQGNRCPFQHGCED